MTDAVRAIVLGMVGVGRPWITDHVVGFTCSTVGLQRDEGLRRVRRVLAVAAEIERAASALPPPEALRRTGVGDAIRREAQARGMSLRGTALCVVGPTLHAALRPPPRSVEAAQCGFASTAARCGAAGFRHLEVQAARNDSGPLETGRGPVLELHAQGQTA